ncbi:MAG: flavin oxidoreductase [Herminiimonas sp.]|nr:flavin oxidoreductase [Herminiimonas sp.]
MNHTIRVAQTDIQFDCVEGDTVLQAAKAAGYELPYSCRSGICGSCKGKVLSGSLHNAGAGEALTPEELASGHALFCQARPQSDIDIAVHSIERIDPNARKTVEAKIYRMTRVTEDITLLQLRFPAGVRVKFKAGQYLHVLLDDGSRRSFSMANPPQQSDGAMLHVRHMKEGKFSGWLASQAAVGDKLKVELPFGDFRIQEDAAVEGAQNLAHARPAVLIASGTGFAPIKSILEDLFRRGTPTRPMALYWGGRMLQDLYMKDLPEKWAQQHALFRFVPVLSEEVVEGVRSGLVHKAVMQDFPSLAGHEVYACGVPAMINAARLDFTRECGLDPDDFHCDAFVPGEAVS